MISKKNSVMMGLILWIFNIPEEWNDWSRIGKNIEKGLLLEPDA